MLAVRFLFFLLTITICSALITQSLNGQWTADGGTAQITIPATVPGGIFSDLMNHGDIDNVFYGSGDTDYSWVGQADWTYSTTFTADADLLASRVVSLIFEGLDTFAEISVNGNVVGTTENMFRRYTYSIKDQLKVGSNTISVKFTSAVNKAQALGKSSNNTYVIPPECPPSEYEGICYVNRIRKMQASFSWDWGPAFASVGIWKDVYLKAFDEAVVDYVVTTTSRDEAAELGSWILNIDTYVNAGGAGLDSLTGYVFIILEIGGLWLVDVGAHSNKTINEYNEIVISTQFTLSDLALGIQSWWPNGYGDQIMYPFSVTYVGDNDEEDTVDLQVGFRTVELVQDELDQGLSFYFKVNGVPIFAKGANEIPLNVLPERGQDPATIEKVLQSAKDAHMNMLRVWGGGVYESDYFYDLADEYGILIWQDFMFACALYPIDDDFLGNVVQEVRHQVKRLSNHPSIAIWAGNNENEAVLAQNWYDTTSNFDRYKQDYNKLYVDTIQPEVFKILPNVNYVTSSPTNGLESDQEDHVATNPGDSLYGDVHFYDYSGDSWSVSTFPTPRFASEFGYQSMPNVEAWMTATDSLNNLKPDSDFLLNRQHHLGGNQQNLDLISAQLSLPAASSANYVQAFIYFSQIVQAQAIKTQSEHYRSYKGRVNERGEGNTMGSLYWQLNDVWVAPTWSGIDFTGRWKLLHYFAQQFYNPMIITGQLTGDTLEVYAVLDGLDVPKTEVKALVHIYRWASTDPLVAIEFPVTLDTSKAVLVSAIDVPSALATAGCGRTPDARADCFFHIHLIDNANNFLVPFNYVFLEKLKNSNIANANVQISSVTLFNEVDSVFQINVTTNAVALFVWLDSHEIRGRFSDNGFVHVQPFKLVTFTADESPSLSAFTSALTVTHLRDPLYL